MKFPIAAALLGSVTAQDIFNYRSTSGTDFGPEDWDEVSCNNLKTCPGWPAKLTGSIGWRPSKNECRWCPATGNNCGQHRQSPIDLQRDRAIEGNPNEKECPDWHWIQYLDGTCDWEDMDGQFEVARNALMIHTPVNNNGDIACVNNAGERKFPKLDYSKGFPDWWYLSRTEITTPSEHVQQGKRYAAEVKLSHFYEIDHYKNKLGIISFFMQDFEGEPSWPYLDKLICKWRREEELKRAACGLPPAPVYKMCELYRGQVRTEDDLEAPTSAVVNPTVAPLVAPPAIPVVNFGGDPEEFRLPLGLCQGDCDFTSDCAPGLICYRRDGFDPVPGCIGGETDETNTDYCVFDPFGIGYTVPTTEPTGAPTITNRPSLTPIDPIPLVDFGGTPPADKYPLQLCQGDCDRNADCAEGLMCFQRTSNETVPGCIGGELDIQKTDYCILDPYGPGYEGVPTEKPTDEPVTSSPTSEPTTAAPTEKPTTSSPTDSPSELPSVEPMPSPYPSYYPRPVGEPLQLENLGWEPPTPLSECQGDCDEDSDCAPGLHCYQRNSAYESVPGCAGGEDDQSLTDYCAYKPLPDDSASDEDSEDTETPTETPTTTPTAKATTIPVPPTENFKELAIVSWNPTEKLQMCEGDCDKDEDCDGQNLVCFQRNAGNMEVPGCFGGAADNSLTDYCIMDPAVQILEDRLGSLFLEGTFTLPITQPAPVPTNAPSVSPTESPTVATTAPVADGLPPIENLGWTPPKDNFPLQNCQGDCDIDSDCAEGLKCFQRYFSNLPVPGCGGGDSDATLTDYCVLAGYVDGTLTDGTSGGRRIGN